MKKPKKKPPKLPRFVVPKRMTSVVIDSKKTKAKHRRYLKPKPEDEDV